MTAEMLVELMAELTVAHSAASTVGYWAEYSVDWTVARKVER